MNLGPVGTSLETTLRAALRPYFLEIIDESNQHLGHAGHHPLGESHFRLRISSTELAGKSRVAQHRMIYDALSTQLKDRVHALAIEVLG